MHQFTVSLFGETGMVDEGGIRNKSGTDKVTVVLLESRRDQKRVVLSQRFTVCLLKLVLVVVAMPMI